MEGSIVIALFTVILYGAIWYFFFLKNKEMERQHVNLMRKLKAGIAIHTSQLKHRDSYLKRYRFSEYNLEEALKPQMEIKI
jgi:hypothetical protein